uniref:DNA-directed RNA polymerase subunit beta'' n=1 Tax=Oedocladium prescottii TaxID=337949 RepID=A0A8K1N1F0_9CHLO|nr:RNA polymerase beta'' subunit [Oedocladium prescottii]
MKILFFMILIKNRNKLKKKNYFIFNQIKKKNSIKLSKIIIPKTLKKNLTNFKLNYYWNQNFDKNRLKNFVFWCFKNYGQNKTIKVLEILKHLGFQYATKAGLSLSIDDLIIPPTKSKLLIDAELTTRTALLQYKNAQITNLERFQKIIETWHITSEKMKDDMIHHFKTTNIFNPLYMMAFSGARGNVSQVRQLVGMRGLMANPQGQILDFPIQSNFREGLTLTEYVISCYGARKGVVDTALRTANAGYLTRRLVDVAQHVIISNFDCGTNRGLIISEMKQGNKLLFSLRQRLLGRVLAQNVKSGNLLIAKKNQEISENLSEIIASIVKKVIIRSPLTCKTTQFICQLCYGWSLAEGKLVGVGETVGIIAAQSIGEPGTQLTMRTFHTGGVFAGELLDQLIAPFDGIIKYNIYIPGNMIRTPQGKIAFLTRIESQFIIQNCSNLNEKKHYTIPPYTILFIRNRETVSKNQLIAQLCSFSPSFKNSSNLIEYKIYSDLEGEIKSTNLKILKKVTEMNDIMHQSIEWGYIWILSGKIYQLPFNSIHIPLKESVQSVFQQKKNFFPIKGDFLTNSSILSEILWINNSENIKLSFEPKTDFYQKFINNNNQYNCMCSNQTKLQWLKKWKKFSEIYSFNSLNKSIKTFNNNEKIDLSTENSLLNISSQNSLLFLTIDKIRYKKLGYFLFFKKNLKNIDFLNLKKNSLKKLKNFTKQNKVIILNLDSTQKDYLNDSIFEDKFFLPMSLESNSFLNQENSLITLPKFFYQKLSNRFFEWFPNQGNSIGSGLIKLSELFIFKNKLKKEISKNNQIRKKQQKNSQIQSKLSHLTFTKKNLLSLNKEFHEIVFHHDSAIHNFPHTSLFFNPFKNENKIKYLNNNYSFILFSFGPLIHCEKQQLSQFHNIDNSEYFDNFSFLLKLSKKKQSIINLKTQFNRTICDPTKQFINNQILKKSKYESKKIFRFISNNMKKDQIIHLKNNKSKLSSLKKYSIGKKLVIHNLNKQNSFINQTKKTSLRKYISVNPIYFFYNKLNSPDFLLKKIFYNKLQLILLLKNYYLFHFTPQVRYDCFFSILSTNYLTKKRTNTFKGISFNFIFSSFFQKVSNIFISFNNTSEIDTNSICMNSIYSYKFFYKKFYYLNWYNIIYKHKIFREVISKNNFNKSKKIRNIKNIKNFHSSFTYYLIKNQFLFTPSFQKQSITQLENIYKKEINNLSESYLHKQKLLFIKPLNNNFLSYLIKKLSLNINKNNDINIIKLVKIDFDKNLFNCTHTLKGIGLINQIKITKKNIENKKIWNKNLKKLSYLQILLNQFINLSNPLFNKKKQKTIFLKNQHTFNCSDIEKKQFQNYTIFHSIYYKKCVPIILMKYKKIEINLNSRSFHNISMCNHFLTRKLSKTDSFKGMCSIIYNKNLLNNQKNHTILKSYLIKLNSLNNIVINSYFKFISFQWLQIQRETSLKKQRMFNQIFFKRLEFSKFINKNLILSNEKTQSNFRDLSLKFSSFKQTENNKKIKLKKNCGNWVSKISEDRLVLYSRFLLFPKEYLNISKKQLSFLFFYQQQKNFLTSFSKRLEIPFYLLLNSNNLSLLHKSLFFNQKISIYNKNFKLKKTITLLTLKNFLNLKKTEHIPLKEGVLSKNNYLQKINKSIFNVLNNFCYNELKLFNNNRQGKYSPLQFNNYYGILKLNKKHQNMNSSKFQSIEQKDSLDNNFFHLSKKSKIFVNKKWKLYKNKKEFIITNQPGWICKPIKNRNIDSDYSNQYNCTYPLHLLNQLLKKHLKLYNQNYINSFKSIPISYKFCQKNLIWVHYTFLKMIELVKNFLKEDYIVDCLNLFRSPTFNCMCSRFISMKTKKDNSEKTNKYCWIINPRSRFLKLRKSNIFFCIKNQTNNTDNIFLIRKGQEFVINNYQNLSYFSKTNLLFLSKKKLSKISENKYQPNTWGKNNGLILKSQYHSIFLNKQKVSQKLISKFPNLETTFEPYFNIPLNKIDILVNRKKNGTLDINKKNITFINNKNNLSSSSVQNNLKINQKIKTDSIVCVINKNSKIFKSQKPLNIFRYFLGFSIPITFDFSFKSSHICWNYFPNYNLSTLKFEKKITSTDFINYLIFKNNIHIQLNWLKKSTNRYNCTHTLKGHIPYIFNCIKMLLRQPCLDWSATQQINLGYQKNLFLAPTKTLLLLSSENSLSINNPIALTKIFSSMKGEILYSLNNKKKNSSFIQPKASEYKITNKFGFHDFLHKSNRSLFLTKSDQISLKFKNDINLNNELDFFKKFNIFKNQKHIRGLKTFQIKSSKQIILIFKILQKIHNNCQFSNQSIKINLGLFIFQGDLLNTFFINNYINNNNIENSITNKKTIKIKKSYMKSIIVNHSGQIIHLNQNKLTLRKGQPIFFSPHCIFHSYNSDFIEQDKPVLSLPYQQLKTGDIVQGIPKIEQLFEARLTFAGKLEYDNLTNILEIIFQTYKNKLTLKLAVRRSIELVQMIIVNSIQRIYRSQGVNISDKHLEIIVKQMTKKVEIIDSGQSGFLIGEHFDLDVVELWNSKLSKIKHVKYKPLILGISKASLQTDSFLSAASFQYTTRILSQSAFFKKRDFLKGLKENIIVGNIIPAGTGYLGNIEDLFETN